MANVSTNESCSNDSWSRNFHVTVLEILIESAISGTAVVLNMLLLVTICCSRLLRTSTHISISSLAASDILSSIYGLGHLTITTMVNRTCFSVPSRDHIDKGLNISYLVNTFSGYINILIVSGERWLFISHPFLYQRLISRNLLEWL